MVFKIENIDLSAYVLAENYKVNSKDVTDTYEDARGRLHKQKIRSKIAGNFEMLFLKKSDYDDFITILNTKKNVNGYYTCTVAVNNTNEIVTDGFFIDVEPSRTRASNGIHQFEKFKVQIEER